MKLNLIVASVPFIFASSIAFAQSLDIGSNENSIKLPETTPSIPVEDPKHNLGVIGEATKDVYQEAFQREIESGKSTPEEAAIIARQEAEAFLYELDQTIDLPNGELLGPHDPLKPQPLPEKPTPVKPEPGHPKPPVYTDPVEKPDPVQPKPTPDFPDGEVPGPREPIVPRDGDLTENAGEGQVMTKMVKLEALENASGSEDPIRDIVDNIKPTPNESGELEPTTPGTFSGESVESLSAALQAQSEEYMDYHDNAMATTQATVNARPQVTNGQFALGAGVGFSGDSEAVSVGAAKSFGESGWSASATVTGTSETTYVETEVSAGAGVQYAF